jgi:hypothetical protein
MKIQLNEDTNLYRGIFWIKDIDNIEQSDLYFQIPCDNNGNINDPEFSMPDLQSSTGKDNYNHKRVWNSLDKKYTDNKSFDYYPRGRVEISNGKATIYASPYIANDKLKNWLIDKFNLTPSNGIKKIRIIADGSEHYKCYLDTLQ